ncbi:MAG: hypothetical protein Q8880_03950 [Bacteroidota bacterium]|nr:hypothetical protein [Bacteroidota bacterium]
MIKKKNNMKKEGIIYIIFLGAILLSFPAKLFSQDTLKNIKDTIQKTEELKGEQINIISSYEPTIQEAFKLNENPKMNDTILYVPNLKYSIQPVKYNTFFQVEQIKPAKVIGESLIKLNRNIVKIGMGNYTSPYFELFLNNLRSKEYAYGVRLKHLSSNGKISDVGFPGYSDNEIELNGKKFFKTFTTYAAINYQRNGYHLYGYNPEDFPKLNKDSITQVYNYIGVNAGITSNYIDSLHYNYFADINYYLLGGKNVNNSNKENFLNLTSMYKRPFKMKDKLNRSQLNIGLNADFYNNSFNIPDFNISRNSLLLCFKPQYILSIDKIRFDIGTNIYLDADSTSKFRIYPDLKITLNVSNNIIIPYVGINGNAIKNSIYSIYNENPFITTFPDLRKSYNKLNAYGGIKGTLSPDLYFSVKGSYTNIENLPLFINDTNISAKNKFILIYDDADLFNLHAEISYKQIDKISIIASGDYYSYAMKNEKEVWEKPNYLFNISGFYHFLSKYTLKCNIYMIGKTFARESYLIKKELKPIVDANLGIEYKFKKDLSFYINLNNILNQQNMRWNNYPVQKFNFLAGLSYSF